MTTETKVTHTPGPLDVEVDAEHSGHFKLFGNAAEIPYTLHIGTAFGGSVLGVSVEQAKANATLWSSAPDMLEALEETLSWIVDSFTDEDDQPQGIVSRAQAAIAKARGGAA